MRKFHLLISQHLLERRETGGTLSREEGIIFVISSYLTNAGADRHHWMPFWNQCGASQRVPPTALPQPQLLAHSWEG